MPVYETSKIYASKVNITVIHTTQEVDCLLCQLNGCQLIYILLSLKYTTQSLL